MDACVVLYDLVQSVRSTFGDIEEVGDQEEVI